MLWCICGVGFIQSKLTGESSDSSKGNCSRVHWHFGMTLDHLLSINFHHLIKHSEHILSQIKLTWSNISVREKQIWTVAQGGCGAGFACRLTWFFNDYHWMSFLPGTMETVSFSQDTTLTYSWTTEGMRHLNTATLPRMERWSATRTV